jgi:hypothetical protein
MCWRWKRNFRLKAEATEVTRSMEMTGLTGSCDFRLQAEEAPS